MKIPDDYFFLFRKVSHLEVGFFWSGHGTWGDGRRSVCRNMCKLSFFKHRWTIGTVTPLKKLRHLKLGWFWSHKDRVSYWTQSLKVVRRISLINRGGHPGFFISPNLIYQPWSGSEVRKVSKTKRKVPSLALLRKYSSCPEDAAHIFSICPKLKEKPEILISYIVASNAVCNAVK